MKVLIFIFTAVISVTGWAETYWVQPVTAAGVSQTDRGAVEELIKISVPQVAGSQIAKTRDRAKWVLASDLLKLGDSYILNLQKQDKAGNVIFGAKMKAQTMSDMDTVAARLTRAVIEGKPVQETADVTNITRAEENQNIRRFKATRQWTIAIGPGWGSNVRSSGGGFTFLLGYLWGLDPDFGINLSWLINSGHGNDDSTFSDFSLGGEYYFSRTKFSPFVGARFGYGTAHMNNSCDLSNSNTCFSNSATGWSGTAVVGYKLFRTSTVNAAVDLSYSYIFDRTSVGFPSLTAIQFAVYY